MLIYRAIRTVPSHVMAQQWEKVGPSGHLVRCLGKVKLAAGILSQLPTHPSTEVVIARLEHQVTY